MAWIATEDLLSTRQVAELFPDTHHRTIQNWMTKGVKNGSKKLKATKIGHRYFIRPADLNAFVGFEIVRKAPDSPPDSPGKQ